MSYFQISFFKCFIFDRIVFHGILLLYKVKINQSVAIRVLLRFFAKGRRTIMAK